MTTGGAPAMMGKNSGFVQLLRKMLVRLVLAFHCVIHQENLCSKFSSNILNDVMSTVVKSFNEVVALSSCRDIKAVLEEMESYYSDFLMHWQFLVAEFGKIT